ncbi:MAG: hypothetical protein RL149_228, partial [Actinomycetota bacterium]
MRLFTKALIAVISLMVLAPITGFVSIESAFQNEITRDTQQLNQAAQQISESSTPLSSALVVTDESSASLSVAFVDMSGSFTSIVEGEFEITNGWSNETLASASKKALAFDDHPSHLLRAVDLGDGEYVVLIASTETATHDRNSNLLNLLIFSIVLLIIGGAGITFLVRRDLRKVIDTLAGTADQER